MTPYKLPSVVFVPVLTLCVSCASTQGAATIELAPSRASTQAEPARSATNQAASDHAESEHARAPEPAAQPLDPQPSAAGGHLMAQPAHELADDSRYIDVVSEAGQHARGLYFNGPMARKLGTRGIIAAVLGGGMNAAVIDLKDGEGRVTYDSQIPDLAPAKRIFFKDAAAFVREIKAAGIYTIARIVCFSDPVIPRAQPERAVMDTHPARQGQVWNAKAHRNSWLDPYNEKNHDLIVAITKEAQDLGFDEIQLDYIRFPVDEGTKFAAFPAQTDKPRRDVLLGLLRRIDEALTIPLGADVFGLTAFRKGDPAGLGQDLEAWAKYVEVFSPMLYVNGMSDWMRHKKENRAGALVEAGVKALRERVGPTPIIRPFLQAFEAGADYYNPEFIAEQIRGARSGGGDGFLFWHPASTYGMVRAGTTGPARGVVFGNDERRAARKRAWKQQGPSEAAAAVDVGASKPAG